MDPVISDSIASGILTAVRSCQQTGITAQADLGDAFRRFTEICDLRKILVNLAHNRRPQFLVAVPVDPLITIVIIGTDTAVRIEARGSQRFIVDLRIGNVVEAGLDTAGIVRGIAYECIVIGIIGGTGLTGNGHFFIEVTDRRSTVILHNVLHHVGQHPGGRFPDDPVSLLLLLIEEIAFRIFDLRIQRRFNIHTAVRDCRVGTAKLYIFDGTGTEAE